MLMLVFSRKFDWKPGKREKELGVEGHRPDIGDAEVVRWRTRRVGTTRMWTR